MYTDITELCWFLNITHSPDFDCFAPSLKGSFVESRSRQETTEELQQFQTSRKSLRHPIPLIFKKNSG